MVIREIFSNVDLSISRGDKIALIGKNGMGKSTFIKSIVKDISYNEMMKNWAIKL